MILEQKIGLILTAAAQYTLVAAHLHMSFVGFVFYQLYSMPGAP
jgi:hypothetical protein